MRFAFAVAYFFIPLPLHWFSLGCMPNVRLKGNRVRIPNSSRCCEPHKALRHQVVTGVNPWEGIVE